MFAGWIEFSPEEDEELDKYWWRYGRELARRQALREERLAREAAAGITSDPNDDPEDVAMLHWTIPTDEEDPWPADMPFSHEIPWPDDVGYPFKDKEEGAAFARGEITFEQTSIGQRLAAEAAQATPQLTEDASDPTDTGDVSDASDDASASE